MMMMMMMIMMMMMMTPHGGQIHRITNNIKVVLSDGLGHGLGEDK